MDFLKVFDQTVREITREVNLKILKVPEIEQKVLDATDDAPWGPHGSALSEIAQATKKFSECQMVMNVLWTRLTETGKDWRYVYKALTVIEYLVGNGSERAVDDIIEHTFQISSLSSFEYVEASGKDMGINVRKKAETIVALLNNKDKIQDVRNKASANREKYVGLSSTGITNKSGATSFSGSGSQSSDGFQTGKYDGDKFRDSYKYSDSGGEEVNKDDDFGNFKKRFTSNDEGKFSTHVSKDQNDILGSKSDDSADFSVISSKRSNTVLENLDDDFDDFDPRGTSTSNAAVASTTQVDLFGPSMVDLLDISATVPAENTSLNSKLSEVDLFADAAFVSASSHAEEKPSLKPKLEDDPFASQAAVLPSTVDLFSNPGPAIHPENNITSSPQSNAGIIDPFAAVPLNNFDGPEFTSYPGAMSSEPTQHSAGLKSVPKSKPPSSDPFQVKSGIWADSLSRGLIDLNISAPKKVSLVDVGIVGGLSDGSDEKEKGPQTMNYMGRAMASGSGLGQTGVSSFSAGPGYDMFSQNYQFGDFQK